MAKSPEFKQMIGDRIMNSDGFTYGYGKVNEYSTTYRHKETVKRCKRADKRSVKNKEDKRLRNDDL